MPLGGARDARSASARRGVLGDAFLARSERRFAGWYLNLEEPFRRTAIGHDSQDLELDVWIPVDEDWRFKDEDMVEQRVREGRFTEEQAAAIRALGAQIATRLDHGERWWDERWASFEPDPGWRAPSFSDGWEKAPVAAAPPPSAYGLLSP